MDEIFIRQKELDLKIPESAAVLGVGGIGSWVALSLALVGVKKLVIVDPDVLEIHNLNRTPYKLGQVGKPKVQAMAELIYERRREVEVLPIKGIEDRVTLEFLKDVEVILDCRDGEKYFSDMELQRKVVAKLGYDGVGMTVTWNPRPKESWGEETRYTVTPSYLVPPAFLATLVVDAIVRDWVPRGENITWTWTDGLKEVMRR